jgi:hypothetical protein
VTQGEVKQQQQQQKSFIKEIASFCFLQTDIKNVNLYHILLQFTYFPIAWVYENEMRCERELKKKEIT